MIERIVITLLLTWVITLLGKIVTTIHHGMKNRSFPKIVLIELLTTGGMPSMHASLVSSLTFAVFYYDGFGNLLVVTFIFALIVLVDSFRMRKSVGDQAVLLNKLAEKAKLKPVSVVPGHTFLEVFVGGVLGALIATIVWLL